MEHIHIYPSWSTGPAPCDCGRSKKVLPGSDDDPGMIYWKQVFASSTHNIRVLSMLAGGGKRILARI